MVGFDIDMGNAIAEELGVKAEWVDTGFDGIFNGLTSNQYEMIIAGTSITEERQKTSICLHLILQWYYHCIQK